MTKLYSPLRYPGGKAKLVAFFKKLIEENNLKGDTYIEPFAGGANVALSLLIEGYVSKVVINDIDRSIYSFWNSILHNTTRFIDKIEKCELTVEEWQKQKNILKNPRASELALGFAVFFLNRTNFSGVITAGPLGGLEQTGKYKINARFNKPTLIKRIQAIASHKANIEVKCKDALALIEDIKNEKNCLVYFDPPYYVQGKRLYTNFYQHQDHATLAQSISTLKMPLVITYDNVDEIKDLYKSLDSREFVINYSAKTHIQANEVMFTNNLPSKTKGFFSILQH